MQEQSEKDGSKTMAKPKQGYEKLDPHTYNRWMDGETDRCEQGCLGRALKGQRRDQWEIRVSKAERV